MLFPFLSVNPRRGAFLPDFVGIDCVKNLWPILEHRGILQGYYYNTLNGLKSSHSYFNTRHLLDSMCWVADSLLDIYLIKNTSDRFPYATVKVELLEGRHDVGQNCMLYKSIHNFRYRFNEWKRIIVDQNNTTPSQQFIQLFDHIFNQILTPILSYRHVKPNSTFSYTQDLHDLQQDFHNNKLSNHCNNLSFIMSQSTWSRLQNKSPQIHISPVYASEYQTIRLHGMYNSDKIFLSELIPDNKIVVYMDIPNTFYDHLRVKPFSLFIHEIAPQGINFHVCSNVDFFMYDLIKIYDVQP